MNKKGRDARMKRTLGKAKITAVVTLSAALVVSVVTAVTAHAQSGSRLCGVMWTHTDENKVVDERVIKFYEVGKYFGPRDRGTERCQDARDGGVDQAIPERGPLADKLVHTSRDWISEPFGPLVCETFTAEQRKKSTTNPDDKLPIEYVGNDWPNQDPDDICNDMNRSGTLDDFNAYWLLWNANTNGKLLFQRSA